MELQSNATLSAAFEAMTAMSSRSAISTASIPLTRTQVVVVAAAAATGIADIAQSAFEILCFIVGVTGTVANGLLLFVLIYEKHVSKSATNKFVCNQTILDGLACLATVVYIAVQWTTASILFPQGVAGWIRCLMVESMVAIYAPVYASQFNLVIISLERYAMVVHPVAHRKYFRPWMVHVGLVVPWINGCITFLIPVLATSRLVGSRCLTQTYWATPNTAKYFGLAVFLWQFIFPITIIVFCYARIVAVIRRQTLTIGPIIKVSTPNQRSAIGVMSPGGKCNTLHASTVTVAMAHVPNTETGQTVSKTERKIIRTMIIIVVCFTICWLPLETFAMIYHFLSLRRFLPLLYILSMVAFINLVVNPIVYGAHFQAARRAFRAIMDVVTKTGDGGGTSAHQLSLSAGGGQVSGHAADVRNSVALTSVSVTR